MNSFNQAISDIGVVPVIKLSHPEWDAAPLAKALCAGEVTFRAAGADKAIRIMRETCPEIIVGAGTYLEQPLNMDICAAQARALMQLYLDADMDHDHHRPIVHGSELIISPHYRQVIVDGKPVELTRKGFDLLHYLTSYPEQVFSSDQPYRQVWNEEPPVSGNDTVKVHIGNLRKKISDIGRECIHMVWGVWYKFSLGPQPNAVV